MRVACRAGWMGVWLARFACVLKLSRLARVAISAFQAISDYKRS